tara:strand:+ start:6592 stop:7995 length:1404 start_codon:yes stop_codon:yes gene_type:complete
MVNIILNEWKNLIRDRLFFYSTVFFVLSLSLVVWMGIIQQENQQQSQLEAQKHVRKQWENLEAMNPHRAAHYGSFAFKPLNILNAMDGGINDITGNVLQLEGHVQNEIIYSEASQALSISKFGKLKSSLILQYVIPLFLIFLSYGSISKEKEGQRIKLLVLQGASIEKLVNAKSISVWIYGLFLLIVTVTIQSILSSTNPEIFKRLAYVLLSYSLYYFIITSLSTYLSATLKDKTSALSSILAIWILWTIFLPKIWGNAVDKIHVLPDRKTFKEDMRAERNQGIDGHNPYDKRREELKNKYLAEYQVDSLSMLPINFDGIVMQADEEYGNLVWDKHFGSNYSIMQKQKSLYQFSGVLNPFASLQSASMGFCGTDMIHHLDFLKKAEDYRRVLIKALNDKHAYGGSKTGDWKWTVDSEFFKSVQGFTYETPMINKHLSSYLIDLLFLFFWVLLIRALIRFNAVKINVL